MKLIVKRYIIKNVKKVQKNVKKQYPYEKYKELRMKSMLKKAEIKIYKLLRENGRQSELSEITEYVISAMICLNIILIVFESMGINGKIGSTLRVLRVCFFIFFLTEYILRVWIADIVMKDRKHPIKSRIKYMLTFRAIIDLLALLPVMLGSTIIDFRIFRVLRLFRIAQLKNIRQYTDILIKVLKLKGSQLLASLFIAFIFMLVCAVIIYDFENKAQPDVFDNILSCLWWSMSAITTVGYGDMCPITSAGKVVGSIMSIFGVFLMAVPVGILTTGFFEINKKTASEKLDVE